MGVALPIIMIIASAVAASTAVYIAITAATIITIALAAVAVASTAASIYFYVEGDMKNSMLFAAIGITSGIGGVYVAAIQDEATAVALMMEGTNESVAAASNLYAGAALQISGYIQSVYVGFEAVLEAIHFKTLLQVNQISYLISPDYRHMMDQVYGQIRDVSAAMGFGAEYLDLVLRNTRTLVLDVSSSMGRSYDLAELAWVGSLDGFFRNFQAKSQTYAANPRQLLWDLDDNIVKPGIDSKATLVQSMILGIEKAIGGAKVLGEDITRVRNDIVRLVNDLPTAITRVFKPELDKLIGRFDDFIKLTYDPAIRTLNAGFSAMGADLTVQKQRIVNITDRIASPAKYLKEAEALPPEEETALEDEVSLLTGEAVDRNLEQFEETIDTAFDEAETVTYPAGEEEAQAIPSPVSIEVPGVWSEVEKEKINTPFPEEA